MPSQRSEAPQKRLTTKASSDNATAQTSRSRVHAEALSEPGAVQNTRPCAINVDCAGDTAIAELRHSQYTCTSAPKLTEVGHKSWLSTRQETAFASLSQRTQPLAYLGKAQQLAESLPERLLTSMLGSSK